MLVRNKNDYTSMGMITLDRNSKWGEYVELPQLIFDKIKDIMEGYRLPESGTYIKITIECNKTISNIELKE